MTPVRACVAALSFNCSFALIPVALGVGGLILSLPLLYKTLRRAWYGQKHDVVDLQNLLRILGVSLAAILLPSLFLFDHFILDPGGYIESLRQDLSCIPPLVSLTTCLLEIAFNLLLAKLSTPIGVIITLASVVFALLFLSFSSQLHSHLRFWLLLYPAPNLKGVIKHITRSAISSERMIFIVSAFSLVGSVANTEDNALEEIGSERLALSPRERELARQVLGAMERNKIFLRDLAKEIYELFKRKPALLGLLLDLTVLIVERDHTISETEQDNIAILEEQFGQRARFKQYKYHRSAEPFLPPENQDLLEAYELLGLSSSASEVEVQKQFRKLAKQFHPDRLPKTLQGEARKVATERFLAIRQAYERICDRSAAR